MMQEAAQIGGGYVLPLVGGLNAALLAAVFQRLGDMAATIRALERRLRTLEDVSRRTLMGG